MDCIRNSIKSKGKAIAYSIKKIAGKAGVSTHMPRYFDEIGLLKLAGTGRMMFKWAISC
jgi:hypothetical protein